MQSINIIVMGITGDLAKRKILPAVAQFAEYNLENTLVKLTGFSRSPANLVEITDILNRSTSLDTHTLADISLEQGDYYDPNILEKLTHDSLISERVILYIALPPETILPILKNIKLIDGLEVDIIIEKPFGTNETEAQEILDCIKKRSLENTVRFIDHYLFKTESQVRQVDIANFRSLKQIQPRSISISALEEVGVGDRLGYYASSGAIKDMVPHLYVLLRHYLKTIHNYQEAPTFKINGLQKGQYETFGMEAEIKGIQESKTETYFLAKGSLFLQSNDLQSETELVFESGKMLGVKNTEIVVKFEDHSVLKWNIAPQQCLTLHNSNDETISINLARNAKMDHTNMLEDLLNHDYSHFVSPEEVIQGWQLYNNINNATSAISPTNLDSTVRKYENGEWPVVWL